ncbi:MAG: hypothetical protein QOE90_1367 [Thermoplasmata archaeon]|nr:hypothetical protein [Thermoplasmata archaeon]
MALPLDAWSLVLIGLAVALFATVGLVRVLGRPRGAPEPVKPIEVPPEEIELREGPVWACMRCGNPSLRNPRLSEGLVPGFGEGLVWVCPRCRFRGQPLVFDDATAYRLFVQGLNEDAKAR